MNFVDMKLKFYVILSFSGFAVLLSVGLLAEGVVGLYTIVCSLLFPVACMMLCPLDHENSMYYLAIASGLFAVSLLCMVLLRSSLTFAVVPLLVLAVNSFSPSLAA